MYAGIHRGVGLLLGIDLGSANPSCGVRTLSFTDSRLHHLHNRIYHFVALSNFANLSRLVDHSPHPHIILIVPCTLICNPMIMLYGYCCNSFLFQVTNFFL